MEQDQRAEDAGWEAAEDQDNVQHPGNGRAGTRKNQSPAPLFLDCEDPPRKWIYRINKKALIRHRSTPLTEIEDTCLHLLKLHFPTRIDSPQWLQEYEFESLAQMAWNVLDDTVLREVETLLADHQGGQDEQELFDEQCYYRLTEVQSGVLRALVDDTGLYIVSGSAGTGKSTVLRALVHYLRSCTLWHPIILAPSGVAAVNMNGWTIHRFFGLAGRTAGSLEANKFKVDWYLHGVRVRDGQTDPFLHH